MTCRSPLGPIPWQRTEVGKLRLRRWDNVSSTCSPINCRPNAVHLPQITVADPWQLLGFLQMPRGRRYEGLAQVNVPHNKGIMVFGSGTGAGIQNVEPNDM